MAPIRHAVSRGQGRLAPESLHDHELPAGTRHALRHQGAGRRDVPALGRRPAWHARGDPRAVRPVQPRESTSRLRSSRYARGLRTCLPPCFCLFRHDHLANPPTWSSCLSVLADDGGGPQSASHTGLVIGDDYRSATSLTGWPVTEATVWKSWSSHRTMRPSRSAVAAMSRSTGPAERCLPVSVSSCWTSCARS